MHEMLKRLIQLQAAERWPADVEVWHVTMPMTEMDIDRSVLADAELQHAVRYRQSADRVRYMATRAALRELLGRRLQVEPVSLRFTATHRGRPELTGAICAPSFNVSHAGEHALITLSDRREVGIDVERVDPSLNWHELVQLVCTSDERLALMAVPTSRQREWFFRSWTAKEALLKALGLGIAEGLHTLKVDPASEGGQGPLLVARGKTSAATGLRCRWLTDIPGYVGCVAFGTAEVRVVSQGYRSVQRRHVVLPKVALSS
jgi:4'-phosphopantetheinyl transferase